MTESHRVFVTGATGFVGRTLVQRLRAEGVPVRCLVRRGSEAHLRGQEAIERVEGDALVPRNVLEGMTGCDAVIHLVGIVREQPARGVTFKRLHVDATANVIAAASELGVRRYLHMSALGTRPYAASRYHQSKWAAEEMVRGSALPWTIFRPSMIYGRGDGLISTLAPMVRRLPVVPVIGEGAQRLQPVAVEQVAEGFVRALTKPEAIKQTYEVGGPDAVSMVELLDLIGAALGRSRVRKIHIPVGVIRPLARALHRLPSFPITPDQIVMLQEDNTCDPTPFFSTFGLTPIPLRSGLDRMLG